MPRPFLSLRRVIDILVAMGCEPQEFPGTDVLPGLDWTVHYIYSPETEGFISLEGYEMDDLVAPSTMDSWERALGTEIPRGPWH